MAGLAALRRHIVRDLNARGARFLIVVAAIALGLAAFTAVLASHSVVSREMNRSYRESDPASAVLHMDRVDEDVVRAVRALPGVKDAVAQRTEPARFQLGLSEWRNGLLFVGDARQRSVGRLVLEEGSWPGNDTGFHLTPRDLI